MTDSINPADREEWRQRAEAIRAAMTPTERRWSRVHYDLDGYQAVEIRDENERAGAVAVGTTERVIRHAMELGRRHGLEEADLMAYVAEELLVARPFGTSKAAPPVPAQWASNIASFALESADPADPTAWLLKIADDILDGAQMRRHILAPALPEPR